MRSPEAAGAAVRGRYTAELPRHLPAPRGPQPDAGPLSPFRPSRSRLRGPDADATAIVCPDDANSLQGALAAMRCFGLIVPLLVGDPAKIHVAAEAAGADLGGIELIDARDAGRWQQRRLVPPPRPPPSPWSSRAVPGRS